MQEQESAFEWLNLKNQSFEGYLEAILPEFDRVAKDLIASWRTERFYRTSQALQEDVGVFEDLLSGGKKLRPAIGMLAYENFDGEDEFREGALRALLGYEIVHNSFLIHDDIIDNSPERRGKPSVHEQYRLRHETTGGLVDHRQYGIAVALNTGSLGTFRVLDILWQIDNKPNRIIEAQKWLRYVIETTLQGQRGDLSDIQLDQLTEKYVYSVYHQKTAVYTVVGSLVLGAILAGAPRKELDYLNTFGVNLGIAFQMVDDHLGMYGDEQLLGKPVDSDIKEGKKTLHFVEGYKRADSSEREFLQSVWGNHNVTTGELDETRVLIERLGVRDFVLERSARLAGKARKVIPKIAHNQTTRTMFEEMTDFVVERNL